MGPGLREPGARGLERGGLQNPGTALLLLGISTYNDGKPGKARGYFVRARGHEKSRTAANGWLTHLDNEAQAAAEAATLGSEGGERPAAG